MGCRQGLVYLNGYLYEGTGLYGQSTLRKVDPATGNVITKKSISSNYFGKGLACPGGQSGKLRR
jgi:glutaminyl-peptide cyclotransferase